MTTHDHTIVAVSSPPGRSWRGLIRLAGSQTLPILSQLTSRSVNDFIPRQIFSATIELPTSSTSTFAAPAAQALSSDSFPPTLPLPVLISFFASPASYTGQDMAEIQIPGHPALLERLFHACIHAGAQPAEPGEFTLRAFLSGKIDLTQAEGISATISASGTAQLQAASLLREGRLGRIADQINHDLTRMLALVEAGIDFTDQEDVTPISHDELHRQLQTIDQQIKQLLAHSRPWKTIQALPKVVLVGPPSVGKSTLFNALLNRPRAVTSPVPGTTRDVLAEPLQLQNTDGRMWEILLIDIAGLESPTASLDHQIQKIARQTILQADLLLLLDGPQASPLTISPPTTNPLTVSATADLSATASPPAANTSISTSNALLHSLLPELSADASLPPVIHIQTKADLLPEFFNQPHQSFASDSFFLLRISAKTGLGLDSLREKMIAHLANRWHNSPTEAQMILQPRHENCLREAVSALEPFFSGGPAYEASASGSASSTGFSGQSKHSSPLPAELTADALRQALNAMEALTGKINTEDILGHIFSTFCVGK